MADSDSPVIVVADTGVDSIVGSTVAASSSIGSGSGGGNGSSTASTAASAPIVDRSNIININIGILGHVDSGNRW
jgi:hypothetical protein